jgi:hypothetical protein
MWFGRGFNSRILGVEVKGSGTAAEGLSWINFDSWRGLLWQVRREEFSKRPSRISLTSSEVLFMNTPLMMKSRYRALLMPKLERKAHKYERSGNRHVWVKFP